MAYPMSDLGRKSAAGFGDRFQVMLIAPRPKNLRIDDNMRHGMTFANQMLLQALHITEPLVVGVMHFAAIRHHLQNERVFLAPVPRKHSRYSNGFSLRLGQSDLRDRGSTSQ